MLITKFQIDAMSRADISEDKRRDFYLYVDEFQNFATDSFATILSEARKYKLNLIMANQYIAQMEKSVQDAVFGNVGSIAAFQVGHPDAEVLVRALGDTQISAQDLANTQKFDIYTRLLINGMPSPVFSAQTFPPMHPKSSKNPQKISTLKKVSREKYAKPRSFVETKIAQK